MSWSRGAHDHSVLQQKTCLSGSQSWTQKKLPILISWYRRWMAVFHVRLGNYQLREAEPKLSSESSVVLESSFHLELGAAICDCFIPCAPFWDFSGQGCHVDLLWCKKLWGIEIGFCQPGTQRTWDVHSPHTEQQAVTSFLLLSFFLSTEKVLNFLKENDCKRRETPPPPHLTMRWLLCSWVRDHGSFED